MKTRRLRALVLLILPTVVSGLIVLGLMVWRMPTLVQIQVAVDRVEFEVAGDASRAVAGGVPFQSLTLHDFSRFIFNPERITLSSGEPGCKVTGGTWAQPGRMVIDAAREELNSGLTLEALEGAAAGVLDRLSAGPGTKTTLEVMGDKTPALLVGLRGSELSAVVSWRDALCVSCDHCRVLGAADFVGGKSSFAFKAHPSRSNRIAEVKGRETSMTLVITPSAGGDRNLLRDIPVARISFTRQSHEGEIATSLRGDAATTYPDHAGISYPAYPGKADIAAGRSDLLILDQLKDFTLHELTLAETGGMALSAAGTAGSVESGPKGLLRDRRLTRLEALWLNPGLGVLFVVLVWVGSTTYGLYKVYRELKP